MKIALIRGPSLTRWELQNFAPLAPQHQLSAFVTASSPEIPQPSRVCDIHRLFWPDVWIPAGRARWFFNGICSRMLGFSYHLRDLTKRLKGFDILHALETHNTHSYQAALARNAYGGRLVITVWETIPGRGESHPLRTARKRFVTRQADAFLAVTQRTRQMLLKEGVEDRRIHVIPMGIDLTHFNPRVHRQGYRDAWGCRSEDFVVLCVARLVPEKGVDHLIQAALSLRRENRAQPLQLILAGDGPKRKVWESWVIREGAAEYIRFIGQQPYDQMPRVLASADALVLPSIPTHFWEEQFGYALVEAMAMGLAVVSTQSGAIPEVTGDAAMLVPPGSSLALAEALAGLSADASKRRAFGERGMARAALLYDSRNIAKQLEQLYVTLIGVSR